MNEDVVSLDGRHQHLLFHFEVKKAIPQNQRTNGLFVVLARHRGSVHASRPVATGSILGIF